MAFAIGAAISAAGALGGSLISSNANSKAAKDQANAIREASAAQERSTREAISARNSALDQAAKRMPEIERLRFAPADDLASIQNYSGDRLRDTMLAAGQETSNARSAAETQARGDINLYTDNALAWLNQGADSAIAGLNRGADSGIGAVTAARGQVEGLFRPVLDEAADTYNPGFRLGLTPNQTIAREDLLRRARGVVAASGLRGAGRGGVATILDADRRFMAQAADTNDGLNRDAEKTNLTLRSNQRNRADAARSALATSAMTTGQSIANLEMGRGQGTANLEAGRGQGIAGVQARRGDALAASSRNMGTIAANRAENTVNAERASLAGLEASYKTRQGSRSAYADDVKWFSGLGLGTASQNAATISNNGDDQARNLIGAGAVNANAGTANAALSSDIIGRIGALGGDYLERYLKANPGGETVTNGVSNLPMAQIDGGG